MSEPLKRITDKKFLSSESEETNLKSLENILPYFFLTDKSFKKAYNAIREDTGALFSDWLGLNETPDRRLWFEMPEMIVKEDNAFFYYKQRLYGVPQEELMVLHEYDVWKAGRLPTGEKLFKYCKNKGYLTEENIKQISQMRTTNQKLYLCISRNSVDMLYASTDQSFTSCVDLTSTHSECYYMGLPDTWVDNDRAIVFITNGKYRRHTIKDQEFKHFRYISRTWVIFSRLSTQSCAMYIVKRYPNNTYQYSELLNACGFAVKHDYVNRAQNNAKKKLLYENNEICTIYSDCGESFNSSFSWTEGFENMPDCIDDVIGGNDCCINCGNAVSEDSGYCVSDDVYCENCYCELFINCAGCEEIYDRTDIQWSEYHEQGFCETCFNDRHVNCSNCSTVISRDEVCTTGLSDDMFCSDCFNANFTCCNICSKELEKDKACKIEGVYFCKECAEHKRQLNENQMPLFTEV